jgi:hypothetical protein
MSECLYVYEYLCLYYVSQKNGEVCLLLFLTDVEK